MKKPLILCARASHLNMSNIPTILKACSDCNEKVHMSFSTSKVYKEAGGKIVCLECYSANHTHKNYIPVMTEEQLEELKRALPEESN